MFFSQPYCGGSPLAHGSWLGPRFLSGWSSLEPGSRCTSSFDRWLTTVFDGALFFELPRHGLPGRHHMSLIDASALPATFDLPKFLLRRRQLLRLLGVFALLIWAFLHSSSTTSKVHLIPSTNPRGFSTCC
ncbi:hypothetical protein ES288_A08G117400v1 [Gossypium darwinii]|uniref:Uncharacterized protein n=1 Tax=Gossypium darwinii TaxID=34276 RepID=A0A5D2FN84_GOSDA|nr:hypothetical protein ES288_A08G117400v1 [Gossypium darwinii]